MSNQKTPIDKKTFVPLKPASPFSSDPFNNRGGKGGGKSNSKIDSGGKKMKSISIAKFKGGSGGDR